MLPASLGPQPSLLFLSLELPALQNKGGIAILETGTGGSLSTPLSSPSLCCASVVAVTADRRGLGQDLPPWTWARFPGGCCFHTSPSQQQDGFVTALEKRPPNPPGCLSEHPLHPGASTDLWRAIPLLGSTGVLWAHPEKAVHLTGSPVCTATTLSEPPFSGWQLLLLPRLLGMCKTCQQGLAAPCSSLG